MLVLTRKVTEKIYIGKDIVITVVDIERGQIRIGVEAPQDLEIHRGQPERNPGAKPDADVHVQYLNHRGEIAMRRIMPLKIWFGATEWHPSPQWMMDVIDLNSALRMTFALANVLDWGVAGG